MDLINHTKKNGMNGLVEKYEHFTQEMQDALLENKKALGKLKRATEEALYESGEKVKDHPWAYIGAFTACALLIGFALGKKK